jgi:hypothetical protein
VNAVILGHTLSFTNKNIKETIVENKNKVILPEDRSTWWTKDEWIKIESAYLVSEGESLLSANTLALTNWNKCGLDIWPGELAYEQGKRSAGMTSEGLKEEARQTQDFIESLDPKTTIH